MENYEQDINILNEHFVKRFGNRYLVTTPIGTWCFLSHEEYEKFRRAEFDRKLSEKLVNHGILLNRDNLKLVLKNITRRYSFLGDRSLLLILVVTQKCNLSCEYCHADASPMRSESMSLEDIPHIVEFINSMPDDMSVTIEFQGGEPLLNFDFIQEFLNTRDKIRRKVLSFRIVSNLTLFDEDMAKFLSDHRMTLSTSLDGPKELHDFHRHRISGAGSFEDVVRGISLAREHNISVGSIATVTSRSLEFGPEPIMDTYLKVGLRSIFYRPLRLTGRAHLKWDLDVTPRGYRDFVERALRYEYFLKKKRNSFIEDVYIKRYLDKIFRIEKPYMCDRSVCGAGINQLALVPNGRVYPCDALRGIPGFISGSYFTDDYSKTIERFSELRELCNETFPLCNTCIYSPFCGLCIADNLGKYGSPIPYTSLDEDCSIKKQIFEFIFSGLHDQTWIEIFKEIYGGRRICSSLSLQR